MSRSEWSVGRAVIWPVFVIAFGRLLLHLAVGNEYGFHRDELATLSDSRDLGWGYVAYPPLVPALGRLGLELFGVTPLAVRWLSALAQAGLVVLAGFMARDLGGRRYAPAIAAAAVAIAPLSMLQGAMFQYVSFDMFWWALLAWLVIRLALSDDPRWWMAIGATIGLGMMTKYTMGFLVAGVVAGVLLTRFRHHLRSPWLWGGVAVSLLIFLPNLVWQIRNEFISLEFLRSISARDARMGRTDGFFIGQLMEGANPFTAPLWMAGVWFLLASRAGSRFRIVGYLWLVPLLLFALAGGRAYYMAGAYPPLIAAGSVALEVALAGMSRRRLKISAAVATVMLLCGGIVSAALLLPIAPVNSQWWHVVADAHDNFSEQLGWHELVDTVARVYGEIPGEERAQTGILTGNYGEAGAIALLGRERGLPEPISGVNSWWSRGYGDGPQTAIVLGIDLETATQIFAECRIVARVSNRYGVMNEESRDHPDVLLCRRTRAPWSTIWPHMRGFG